MSVLFKFHATKILNEYNMAIKKLSVLNAQTALPEESTYSVSVLHFISINWPFLRLAVRFQNEIIYSTAVTNKMFSFCRQLPQWIFITFFSSTKLHSTWFQRKEAKGWCSHYTHAVSWFVSLVSYGNIIQIDIKMLWKKFPFVASKYWYTYYFDMLNNLHTKCILIKLFQVTICRL